LTDPADTRTADVLNLSSILSLYTGGSKTFDASLKDFVNLFCKLFSFQNAIYALQCRCCVQGIDKIKEHFPYMYT